MPWVGGELCRGAFQNGRESYGLELLRQYSDHLRRTGGAQVWYFTDGTPGFRTTNEVDYAGWGMAQWVEALLEGLGGVRDDSTVLGHAQISPRWAITPFRHARVSVRYAASAAYFTYTWTRDDRAIRFDWSGSGETADFRVLLPLGSQVQSVVVDGKPGAIQTEEVGPSRYLLLSAPAARGSLAIRL